MLGIENVNLAYQRRAAFLEFFNPQLVQPAIYIVTGENRWENPRMR